MPGGASELLARRPLAGKSVFIAHGRQDNMIPVEQAHKSVELLDASGARVTYCESDDGHKVSGRCFTRLAEIFR
jgi:predicted esterase